MNRPFDLKDRTMQFAVDISDFCETLPDSYRGRHVMGQLFRAGSSTAANYRAACRRKSTADFISKLGTAIEEADESDFWLEFAVATRLAKAERVGSLRQEAGELVSIFLASQHTSRENEKARKPRAKTPFSHDVPD